MLKSMWKKKTQKKQHTWDISHKRSPWYNCNGWLGVKHQVTYSHKMNRCWLTKRFSTMNQLSTKQLVLILPPISKQKLHGCRVFNHVWSAGKTSVQNPVHAHYLDFCHVEQAVVFTVASFHSLQGVVSLIKARAFQQTAYKTNKIINNTLAKLHRNNS